MSTLSNLNPNAKAYSPVPTMVPFRPNDRRGLRPSYFDTRIDISSGPGNPPLRVDRDWLSIENDIRRAARFFSQL